MSEGSTDLLPPSEPGLTLLTGANGSGKSGLARALEARVAGAHLLSAESQQLFFEAELARDDSNFHQGVDTSSTVRELVGEAGRAHPLFRALRLEGLWERGYRLLSTGEARKALLLRAVLGAPSLLILDDPFDGLDREARAELSRAIVELAGHLPVIVVGVFGARSLPFPPQAVREVVVIAGGIPVFRGTPQAFSERAPVDGGGRTPPPVELGSWYDPLEPSLPLVQLRDGHVRYGEHTVFERLEFVLEVGQHTLIEGPNGSGKSSLLEMLSGDHPQAYDNDLTLFGRRRGTGETIWDIKKNVGVVSSRLHRDYRVASSVEEVLLSGLFDSIGVYQRIEPSHRARARAWLSWLELGLTPSAPFRELSFGQQRLVLVARAAIKVPPLVVLDEPTSGLDEHNTERILGLVESLCTQRKSTVLMVTHRAEERAFWQEKIGGPILSLATRSAPPPAAPAR